jgi:hypothetical protein
MVYMTSFERIGIIKAHVKTVLRQLNKNLGEVPIKLQSLQFSIFQLQRLKRFLMMFMKLMANTKDSNQ